MRGDAPLIFEPPRSSLRDERQLLADGAPVASVVLDRVAKEKSNVLEVKRIGFKGYQACVAQLVGVALDFPGLEGAGRQQVIEMENGARALLFGDGLLRPAFARR